MEIKLNEVSFSYNPRSQIETKALDKVNINFPEGKITN